MSQPQDADSIVQDGSPWSHAVKTVSLLEIVLRNLAKVAAGSGIAALLLWLTYVMLDVQHMNSGFTLPQTSYN